MARIGIMTFLHNDNYGSILQAWALQNAVRSLGYDAEHIDYVPSQTEKMKNLLCSGNSPRLILDGMKKRSASRGLNEGFDAFRQTQMILSPICRDQSALAHQALSYDALICGSDQIWSPTWLNPAYFLNFTKKPKVAYAPSLGVSTMTDSAKGRKIAALTKGFAAISVREEEGAALLQTLIGKKPAVMPDPVMLLPREKWLELIGGDIPMDLPADGGFRMLSDPCLHRLWQWIPPYQGKSQPVCHTQKNNQKHAQDTHRASPHFCASSSFMNITLFP